MSRSRLITVLAVAALGVAALLPAGNAVAGKVTNVKSTVTILSGEGNEFTGKVAAGNRKCRDGRRVKLFVEPPGAGDELVGVGMTNSAGNWEIKGSFMAGTYHAQVAGTTIHSGSSTVRCLVDVSISARF